jgi:hypothetical protein
MEVRFIGLSGCGRVVDVILGSVFAIFTERIDVIGFAVFSRTLVHVFSVPGIHEALLLHHGRWLGQGIDRRGKPPVVQLVELHRAFDGFNLSLGSDSPSGTGHVPEGGRTDPYENSDDGEHQDHLHEREGTAEFWPGKGVWMSLHRISLDAPDPERVQKSS